MTLLEIEGLAKSYLDPEGRRQDVLRVESLTVDEGEQLALRGRSGSGKTTLLNLIAGLGLPDSGHIRFAGTDITALSEAARDRFRAKHLGYVFQTFNLLQGYSALENVVLGMAFGPGRDRPAAQKLLERLGLGDRLGYRPAQLSVGQQQRVAVARALANRPRLVLADEPTGNLDPTYAGEALELMRSMCTDAGAALLLVSHDEAVLERFDRCVDLAEINTAQPASAEATR